MNKSFQCLKEQQELYDACLKPDNLHEIQQLLQTKPNLSINFQTNEYPHYSPLHLACSQGKLALIELLLNHPGVDPNFQNIFSVTPFLTACEFGRASAVQLLLQDKRVDVKLCDMLGRSGFWYAVYSGHVDCVECMLIHNKLMQVQVYGGWSSAGAYLSRSVMELARLRKKEDVENLLKAFQADPDSVIQDLQFKGTFKNAARTFIFGVMICDDYFSIPSSSSSSPSSQDHQNARRFFRILINLPMELQMLICNRLHRVNKIFIPVEAVNHELRYVLRNLLLRLGLRFFCEAVMDH